MGSQDFFITKYNTSGTKQWTKQLGVSSKDTYGQSVATDSSGNVFIGGYTTGGLDGNALTGAWCDFFVTKYNISGTKQWTKQLGASGKDTIGYGVATDSSGNVFIGGLTTGGLDGNTLIGSSDFFITKYNSSGTKQWTKQMGVIPQATQGFGVATDTSGNVFIGGRVTGGLDGNTLTGSTDFFITKYDSSGVKQWTRQLGVSTKDTLGYGVSTDSSGNVFIGGYTTGGLDGNTLTGGTYDFFVTKYGSSGAKQWTKQLGAPGKNTYGSSVATDSSGNVFIGGYTTGGLDGNTLTGKNDFFVTKYDSSGTKQ
jgi:outer membrane protein assembly factor BamB